MTPSMLQTLDKIEQQLPHLIQQQKWSSLYIDYEQPIVERLWTQYDKYRINLHKIHPCNIENSLLHPHPWPSAMKILQGTYLQQLGHETTNNLPEIDTTILMAQGSAYEMININTWHRVAPQHEPVYSIMITGAPWNRSQPKPTKTLEPLTITKEKELLEWFTTHYKLK